MLLVGLYIMSTQYCHPLFRLKTGVNCQMYKMFYLYNHFVDVSVCGQNKCNLKSEESKYL